MTLIVESPKVCTKLGVPVSVTGIAQVKIQGSNKEMLEVACEQFLGKAEKEIAMVALETLEGHQRAIMGLMTVEEIFQDSSKECESMSVCNSPNQIHIDRPNDGGQCSTERNKENDPFPPWATAIVVTVGVAILIILTIVLVSNRERLPACFGHPVDRCLNDPRYHPEAIVMMHPKEPLVERGSEGSTVNSSGPLEANLPSFGDPMPEALKQGKEIDGPIDPVHNDVEYQMGRHERGRKTAVKVADEKQADPIFLMQALGDLFVQHGAKNDAVGIQEPKMAAPKIPAIKKAAPKIPAIKKAAPKIPAIKKAAPKNVALNYAPVKKALLKNPVLKKSESGGWPRAGMGPCV